MLFFLADPRLGLVYLICFLLQVYPLAAIPGVGGGGGFSRCSVVDPDGFDKNPDQTFHCNAAADPYPNV